MSKISLDDIIETCGTYKKDDIRMQKLQTECVAYNKDAECPKELGKRKILKKKKVKGWWSGVLTCLAHIENGSLIKATIWFGSAQVLQGSN